MELLEREDAVARIDHLADALISGKGGILTVEAAPGLGKTSLIMSAQEIALGRGIRVLGARGGEFERGFGFGLARQLLERTVTLAADDVRAEIFSGPARCAARSLGFLSTDVPEAGSSFAVTHGLYWLVVNLALVQPLLLVVDDVQWSDEPSWEWLRYLARRVDGLPLGLMIAGRSDDAWPADPRSSDLARLRDEEPLLLHPLSGSGVRQLVEARSGRTDPEFVRVCHELTGGNPFLVVELLRAVASNAVPPTARTVSALLGLVPERVEWSVRDRLRRIGPSAEAAAEALAVLGHGDLAIVAELAGLALVPAAAAVDALARSEIVGRDLPLEFIHPLVRQVIYSGVPPARRVLLHRQAAGLLADTQSAIGRVASQLMRVPPAADAWAAARLLEAGREACAQRAHAIAVQYLARALVENSDGPLRSDILFELGLAEERLRHHGSIRHLSEALELTDDPLRVATLARTLGRALCLEGRVSDGIDVLETGIARLAPRRPDLVAPLEMHIQAVARTEPSCVDRANRRLTCQLDALDGHAAARQRVEQYMVQGPCWQATDWRESERIATVNLSERRGLLEAEPETLGYYTSVQALGWCDLYERALEHLNLAFDVAAASGSITAHVLASTYRAEVNLRRGMFAGAEADASAALELIEEHRLEVPAALAYAWLVMALVETGATTRAWDVLRDRGFDEAIPQTCVFAMLHEARAQLHSAQHAPALALRDALAAGRLLQPLGPGPTPLPWRATAALAAEQVGAGEQALDLASEDLALARRFGAPRALGIALRTQALVSNEDPVERLRQSVKVLEASEARGEHARSILELGSAMRRGRHPVASSRVVLTEALDISHRCGATMLEQRARDELIASGARPRRSAVRGRDALTPRELRVAQLAAAGSTNREIAQTLFVTLRTVEHHLSSTYSKLGVKSRHGLQEHVKDL